MFNPGAGSPAAEAAFFSSNCSSGMGSGTLYHIIIRVSVVVVLVLVEILSKNCAVPEPRRRGLKCTSHLYKRG